MYRKMEYMFIWADHLHLFSFFSFCTFLMMICIDTREHTEISVFEILKVDCICFFIMIRAQLFKASLA